MGCSSMGKEEGMQQDGMLNLVRRLSYEKPPRAHKQARASQGFSESPHMEVCNHFCTGKWLF
jgi:hypothetical protein